MSIWTGRAKGLWHDSKTALATNALDGMQFLISKVGQYFVQGDCNAAYAKGIPFGLFFEADPEQYLLCPVNDFNRWPNITNDPTIKMLDNYIMSGTSKRAIHFIVVDCSKTITTDGKTITSTWITATGQRLISLMWEKYKLPIYLYMNMNPINSATNAGDVNGKEALNLFLNANGDGLSTFSAANVGTDGYPVDTAKPKLAYDGGKPWGFWLYSAGTNGIATISSKDSTSLYAELNYAPPASSGTTGGTTSGTTGGTTSGGTTTGGTTVVSADMTVTNGLLAQVLLELQKITKHLAP